MLLKYENEEGTRLTNSAQLSPSLRYSDSQSLTLAGKGD